MTPRLAGQVVPFPGSGGYNAVQVMRILLVEDDPAIRDFLGLELIDRCRGQSVAAPVLILSARRTVDERVEGLKKGGDDYLTKPFALPELRRSAPPGREATTLRTADLEIDLLRREARRDGRLLDLTSKEFALLVHRMIRSRTDTWLRGESMLLAELVTSVGSRPDGFELLRDEAGHALREITEDILDGDEAVGTRPGQDTDPAGTDSSPSGPPAFFLWTDAAGKSLLWVGPDDAVPFGEALGRRQEPSGQLFAFDAKGWPHRFRGVLRTLPDGSRVALGVLDLEALRLARRLGWLFAGIWALMAILGGTLSWLTARSILSGVEAIARTADGIDSSQLDRIQASVHQIRTMTDGLAHDLRSPLTAVRGRLELAAGQSDPASMREAMAAGLEGIDRMLGILDDNLDVAEAEAGLLRLRLAELDMGELVEEMVSFYRPAAEERGIALVSAGPATLREWGDADLLRRALANLLDNAIRHLPGGSRVVVELESGPDGVRLSVGDDGPGLPDEVQERAFERFVRGVGSRGSGLGLAVVRAVARSRLGGASVILTLPGASTPGSGRAPGRRRAG